MEGPPSKDLFHTTQYNLDILQVGFEPVITVLQDPKANLWYSLLKYKFIIIETQPLLYSMLVEHPTHTRLPPVAMP
jgi:hypothetical protein